MGESSFLKGRQYKRSVYLSQSALSSEQTALSSGGFPQLHFLPITSENQIVACLVKKLSWWANGSESLSTQPVPSHLCTQATTGLHCTAGNSTSRHWRRSVPEYCVRHTTDYSAACEVDNTDRSVNRCKTCNQRRHRSPRRRSAIEQVGSGLRVHDPLSSWALAHSTGEDQPRCLSWGKTVRWRTWRGNSTRQTSPVTGR